MYRTHSRRRRDAGASAAEYAGIVVLAAVILGVMTPLLTGSSFTQPVRTAICHILAEQNCGQIRAAGDDGGGGDGPVQHPLTKADYQQQLCQQLQIDCANWDPARGVSCNDDAIEKSWSYYGQAFDRHPELQWAGMGKLASSLIYAGLQDVHVLRGMTKDERLRWLAANLSGMPKPLIDALANAGADQFDFFETKIADMQKHVFYDLGWQHYAYEQGGIAEMRRLYAAGQLSPQLMSTWEDVASGDPARVKRGNEGLLYREQHDILQPMYDQMRDHDRPIGDAFTYMIGLTADSPIPGGKPFRDVVNKVHLPLGITLRSPLPTGNIASMNSRWEWITEDMLPRFQYLLDHDPQGTKNEIDKPLSQRAKGFRIIPDSLVPYNPKDGLC